MLPLFRLLKPIEYIPRPSLLGLGAQTHLEHIPNLKRKKRGNEEYVLPMTSEGKVQHFRAVDQPLQKKLRLEKGSFVRVRSGKHAELHGVVQEWNHDQNYIRVSIPNGEKIKVDVQEVVVVSRDEYDLYVLRVFFNLPHVFFSEVIN
jgi:G patch domain/KOW motif-containing protein